MMRKTGLLVFSLVAVTPASCSKPGLPATPGKQKGTESVDSVPWVGYVL